MTTRPNNPLKDPRTEDLGLEESIRVQVEHSRVATGKLNALERAKVLEDLPKGKQREQTLMQRIEDVATRNSFPPAEHDALARLDFDDVLRLLLASLQGRFASGVHRQKCGSPVPFNPKTSAYETLFYVSKERKLAKLEENGVDIPVRYQGFNKSTVWFSESMPHWGIVARRMQHQARMKQKQASLDADMATKSSLFFHVFEGFSYVLLRRDDPNLNIPKAALAKYIVEDAAKIVHIWPLSRARAGASLVHKPSSSSLPMALPPLGRSLGLHGSSLSLDGDESSTGKRSFHDMNDDIPELSFYNTAHLAKRGRQMQHPQPHQHTFVSQPHLNLPPTLDEVKHGLDATLSSSAGYSAAGNTNYDDITTAPEASSATGNHHGELDVYDFLLGNGGFDDQSQDDFNGSAISLPGFSASLSNTPARSSATNNMRSTLSHDDSRGLGSSLVSAIASLNDSSSFVFESKHSYENCMAAPAGPAPFAAPVPDAEETHKSLSEQELVNDIDGSALAKHLLQTLSNGMEVLQFANDYARICHTLFETEVPRFLRRAILQHDCRVDPDFLYPRFTSFVDGVPVGTVSAKEDPARPGLHLVESADETARQILKRNPVGMTNFIGTLDLSDATSVMARYYRVRFGNSREWFHRVITVNGKQIVLRCHSKAEYTDEGSLLFVTRIQDVTFLYPETQGCRPLP